MHIKRTHDNTSTVNRICVLYITNGSQSDLLHGCKSIAHASLVIDILEVAFADAITSRKGIDATHVACILRSGYDVHRDTIRSMFMYLRMRYSSTPLLGYFLAVFAASVNPSTDFGVISTIMYENHYAAFEILLARGIRTIEMVTCAIVYKHTDMLVRLLENQVTLPEHILQRVVTTQRLLGCVSRIVKSLDHDHQVRLLSHAIGHNNIDCVNIILDAGHVTVNDHPRHFLIAVKKKKYDIAMEFIRRGVTYNTDFIHMNAQRDLTMRGILTNGLM